MHLHASGTDEFHGYVLAKQMRDDDGARRLIAHGTLYKALDRLGSMGYLESRWEDPVLAAEENRPRRRFYRVTPAGSKVLAESPAPVTAPALVLRQEASQ